MNIALVGFKSCGKSSLGAALARIEGRAFADTDAWAEDIFFERRKKRLSCREIYSLEGEEVLRELESEALRRLAGLDGMVVATGGGIVLREENIPLLRRNCLCVFLDLPLPALERRLEGRPPSPLFREKSLAATYRERRPLYLEAALLRFRPEEKASPEANALALRKLCREYRLEHGLL
ncbi:MAG: shikimate kinase [Deltaproteobacteria bacterium]|jgi:shikimate kinase|nr:shikimate kinase [Deltaproteobacteria bacterium]